MRLRAGTVGDQVVDNRWICQSRGVTKIFQIIRGNFPQDAPHDFPRSGLRQAGCPLNVLGFGKRSDLAADQLDKFSAKLLRIFVTVHHQGDVGVDAFTFDLVWETDHGSFSHFIMQYQGTFDLSRADAMAGDIDDVIDPSGDPVVAIRITTRAVTGEKVSGVLRVVGIDDPLMITIDAADLPWPAAL